MSGSLVAVCLSEKKGLRKTPVSSATLKVNYGIVGDAHAGNWHRQVSLLGIESIKKMQQLGLNVDYGDFAENLTTQGIDLTAIPVGAQLTIGQARLEITQIGKTCHTRCEIYHQAGDCVMPREGIFAKVLVGGEIKSGDPITVAPLKEARTL
ncbi:MAG: MOSC domain-containing protein [Desulfuromonadales bacterium]|jgi:MOSC domain-containing protein YiiM